MRSCLLISVYILFLFQNNLRQLRKCDICRARERTRKWDNTHFSRDDLKLSSSPRQAHGDDALSTHRAKAWMRPGDTVRVAEAKVRPRRVRSGCVAGREEVRSGSGEDSTGLSLEGRVTERVRFRHMKALREHGEVRIAH